ncbi:MAG: thioredoxin domain-containing protein [Archangium sp.]|nr:thioredoxin domain-containing protein [Archangium sp.]
MTRSLIVFVSLLAGLSLAGNLPPAQFKSELEAQHGLVLDVRTPGEVARGKLAGASVIDFSAPKFEQKVSLIARDKPVFVYCASGNRSGQAAALMAQLGFTKVYNLSGGIGAWKASGFPVESSGAAPAASGQGLTPEAFDALIKKEKRLLVDFQTPWCTPCQKMVPVVDALKSIKVLKVDLDQSEALGTREQVQGVPVFVLYVDGKERGRLFGEQTREALEALAKK